MAIYHCDIKIISRKSWPSILKPAAYRSGERLRDVHTGKVYNYRPRLGVLYTQIMAPKHLPAWVFVRADLWNAVELIEKRKDAQLAREIMVALPSELNIEQWIELIERFISENFIAKGLIADFAIHAPSESGDERNFHAHILLTTRSISPEGFGLKVRELNLKHNIFTWRQSWQDLTNQALEQAGLECKVDCRSHADKGLDREPQLHLGYKAMLKVRQLEQTGLDNHNREIEAINATTAKTRNDSGITDKPNGHQTSLLKTDHNQCPESTNSSQIKDMDIIPDHLLSPRTLIDQLNQCVDSADERTDLLKELTNEFDEREIAIQYFLNNASAEKIRDRLQLQANLESAFYKQIYNTTRARILENEFSKKNVNEIAACQHRARKAGYEFNSFASEWNFRAVSDMSYTPTDPQLENKITALQELFKHRYSDLSIQAENAGWSSARYEREVQSLQQTFVHEIELSLGLDLTFSHEMSIER